MVASSVGQLRFLTPEGHQLPARERPRDQGVEPMVKNPSGLSNLLRRRGRTISHYRPGQKHKASLTINKVTQSEECVCEDRSMSRVARAMKKFHRGNYPASPLGSTQTHSR